MLCHAPRGSLRLLAPAARRIVLTVCFCVVFTVVEKSVHMGTVHPWLRPHSQTRARKGEAANKQVFG